MNKLNIKVENFEGAVNQFIIKTDDATYFQSYNSIIVLKTNGKIYLDRCYWNHSKTTGKYRNKFLGDNDTNETKKKIKSREYILTDLN